MALEADMKSDGFDKGEYKHNFKDRVHISKSKIDMYSSAHYLHVGETKRIKYTEEVQSRYIAADNIVYDVLVSVYDINTRDLIVSRIYKSHDSSKAEIVKFMKSLEMHKPNLEARIIGMQSDQNDFSTILDEFIGLFIKKGVKLVEVDLFGTNTRHVAIDAKLGTSYNILLENRIYRAGELANNLTVENFEKGLSKGIPD